MYKEGNDWSQSWNFGPNDQSVVSVGKLVGKIATKIGGTYEIQQNDTFHEAMYLKLDCSKAKMKLGWTPILSMEETLDYIADWFYAYLKKEDMQQFSLQQIKQYTQKSK